MRKVTLGNTNLSTTALGYGCAGLMRPGVEAERQALLKTAFDAGIRHFDVARYYGHGQSEGVLGRFIADTGCRNEITVTTKFGMEPPAIGGSSRGRLLMSVARKAASLHPAVRQFLSKRANAGVSKNRFDVESARRSLETSLRELQTDRIDLFLLHEANLEDSRTEGLLEFLEAAKQTGKIRAYGLGSDFPLVPAILEQNPAMARVLQIANGPGQWNRRKLAKYPGLTINTHGALKVLPTLEKAFVMATDERAVAWKNLGSPLGPQLAGFILGLVMHDNPHGITLFSSTQPGRIASNVAEALRWENLNSAEWQEIETVIENMLSNYSANTNSE